MSMLLYVTISLFNIHINLPNHLFLKIGQTHFCPVAQEFKNKHLLLYVVGWNKTNLYNINKIDRKRIRVIQMLKIKI